MTTPEHIKRIIERLDPVDREALEQHLKDKSIMGDLMCLADIRAAIGDPHGKLMQDEVVNAISSLVKERDELERKLINPTPERAKINRHGLWGRPSGEPSLAEVRAQAVLEFANSVQRDSIHSPTLKALAKHYAEQLRKEDQ